MILMTSYLSKLKQKYAKEGNKLNSLKRLLQLSVDIKLFERTEKRGVATIPLVRPGLIERKDNITHQKAIKLKTHLYR